MPIAVDYFTPGRVTPKRTVAQVAESLSGGEMLVRRGLGCWIDFAVLALLYFGPGFLTGHRFPGMFWVGVALAAAYFPITEGRWGRSLGKVLTATIVVRADGRTPSYLQAIVRTLLRLFEVNPFLLGGLPAGISLLVTRNKRRLGDLASATFVIPYSEWKYLRADELPLEVFD